MDQFLFDVDILFILLENTLYLLGLYCLVCISVQCCDLLGQSQTPHHLLIGMRQVGTYIAVPVLVVSSIDYIFVGFGRHPLFC